MLGGVCVLRFAVNNAWVNLVPTHVFHNEVLLAFPKEKLKPDQKSFN